MPTQTLNIDAQVEVWDLPDDDPDSIVTPFPGRNQHERGDHNHFGLTPGSLVIHEGSILPTVPAGSSIEEWIRWLNDHIGFLEAGLSVGYLTLDSWVLATISDSLTIDAWIGSTSGQLTIDAIIQALRSGSLTIDAIIQVTRTGSFTIDAFIELVITQSFTIDAWILATRTGSITIDAWIEAAGGNNLLAEMILGEDLLGG